MGQLVKQTSKRKESQSALQSIPETALSGMLTVGGKVFTARRFLMWVAVTYTAEMALTEGSYLVTLGPTAYVEQRKEALLKFVSENTSALKDAVSNEPKKPSPPSLPGLDESSEADPDDVDDGLDFQDEDEDEPPRRDTRRDNGFTWDLGKYAGSEEVCVDESPKLPTSLRPTCRKEDPMDEVIAVLRTCIPKNYGESDDAYLVRIARFHAACHHLDKMVK